jgi:hypothetical protein
VSLLCTIVLEPGVPFLDLTKNNVEEALSSENLFKEKELLEAEVPIT